MSKPANLVDTYKTPLHRARGLGAAPPRVGGVITERVSRMAMITLALWGVWATVHVAPTGYAGAAAFLRGPVNATLAVLLMAFGFYHVRLVVKEALEDYVADHHVRVATLLLNSAVAILGGALAVVSILKVALSAA